MKIKLLIASLLGVVAINGAVAGTYCAPPAECAKCPVECCDDRAGHIGVSYMSDYFFRGVRYSRDAVAVTGSYTLDNCIVPVTLGFNHISSLASRGSNLYLNGLGAGGDQSSVFGAIQLPSFFGFDSALRYDHFFYPNWRQQSGNSIFGDSHGQISLVISRELFCGLNFSYTRAHDFHSPSAQNPFTDFANGGNGRARDNGAWIHTLALDKSFCISECIGLDLSGGVLYTDNVWPNNTARFGGPPGRSSGWNNYFLEAALPICVGPCATLTPYVGYNGTPDGWLADGVIGIAGDGANANDALHGGVRFGVSF